MKKIAVAVGLLLIGGSIFADSFRVSGGFRSGTAAGNGPGAPLNYQNRNPGDAYTRSGLPHKRFTSNPGDAYYDTTIQRNEGYVPNDFNRDRDNRDNRRPGKRPDGRPNPKSGSEVRTSR